MLYRPVLLYKEDNCFENEKDWKGVGYLIADQNLVCTWAGV